MTSEWFVDHPEAMIHCPLVNEFGGSPRLHGMDQARGATILGARLPQLPIEIEEREHHSSLRRRARHQSQANKRVMRYVNCCWLLIDG